MSTTEMRPEPMGVGGGVIPREITTEAAVTLFQLSAGLFGGLAAILAARRLSQVDGTVSPMALALPVLIAGGSTVAGALLLPTGGAS